MLSYAMVTPAGSNFDTFWFAVASYIELDGTVQKISIIDGRELFNLCKAMDPVKV